MEGYLEENCNVINGGSILFSIILWPINKKGKREGHKIENKIHHWGWHYIMFPSSFPQLWAYIIRSHKLIKEKWDLICPQLLRKRKIGNILFSSILIFSHSFSLFGALWSLLLYSLRAPNKRKEKIRYT